MAKPAKEARTVLVVFIFETSAANTSGQRAGVLLSASIPHKRTHCRY